MTNPVWLRGQGPCPPAIPTSVKCGHFIGISLIKDWQFVYLYRSLSLVLFLLLLLLLLFMFLLNTRCIVGLCNQVTLSSNVLNFMSPSVCFLNNVTLQRSVMIATLHLFQVSHLSEDFVVLSFLFLISLIQS